jgi:arginase
MPTHQPLSNLRIVEAQYSGPRIVAPDYWCFDAYKAGGAYDLPGVDVEIVHPLLDEAQLTDDDAATRGLIDGFLADSVADGLRQGQAVALVGGGCGQALAVLGGMQDAYGPAEKIGLVWFDAHGDINTPQTTLSGSLGGMPVAVCCGLALPKWREGAHVVAPLPVDRLLLVDVRDLDPAEVTLIDYMGISVAAPAAGFPGVDLAQAVDDLASRVDRIYLHIDSDILDVAYMPNHHTPAPNGPNMEQVVAAVEAVMATGIVSAYAQVSVYTQGEGADVSIAAGTELLRWSLALWEMYGMMG